MDKNRISDDKKTTVQVHSLPAVGMRGIHRQYGLWIIRGNTGWITRPDSYGHCPERYFQYYSISHMYDGAGLFWLKDTDACTEVQPGDFVIVTPQAVHRYGGWAGKSYCEDALIFSGPVADMLMRSGILASGVFRFGKVRRLMPIIDLVNDPAVDSQIRANIELQKLLVEIYLEKNSSHQAEYPLLDELLEEIRRQPEKWWSVREMAEMCNLSTDQLRRIFQQRTGVRPKIYVDRLKLNHAAEYLVSTDHPVAEIAARFGYKDQYHFSRRFKAVQGMSPQQYRRSFALIRSGQLSVSSAPTK